MKKALWKAEKIAPWTEYLTTAENDVKAFSNLPNGKYISLNQFNEN